MKRVNRDNGDREMFIFPSQESIKPPSFIKEPTLERTLEQIRKVPKEKRRIIVYAGVHPNEGTDKLAQKYAQRWADKYDVLVVCQPTEETPHGIWEKRRSLVTTDGEIPRLPPDLILDEEDYEDQFSLGDETFFVSFHGTYDSEFRDKTRGFGLEFETSRYVNHPEDFVDRRSEQALRFRRPDIVSGLEGVITKDGEGYKNTVVVEKHQDDDRWYPEPPNTLLVEYYYRGKPFEVTDPYLQKLITINDEADKNDPGLLSQDNWHRQMNIGPEYLNQPTLTEEDIRLFDEHLIKDFERMLEYLRSRLPALES